MFSHLCSEFFNPIRRCADARGMAGASRPHRTTAAAAMLSR
jgi:hypothetical protein